MRKNKTLFEYSIELALAAYLHPHDKAEKQIKTMVRRFKKEVSADRVKVTKSFKLTAPPPKGRGFLIHRKLATPVNPCGSYILSKG